MVSARNIKTQDPKWKRGKLWFEFTGGGRVTLLWAYIFCSSSVMCNVYSARLSRQHTWKGINNSTHHVSITSPHWSLLRSWVNCFLSPNAILFPAGGTAMRTGGNLFSTNCREACGRVLFLCSPSFRLWFCRSKTPKQPYSLTGLF